MSDDRPPDREEGLGRQLAMQQRIRHRDRAHRVVGRVRAAPKELEVLRPVVIELVDRADDVADDRFEHIRGMRDEG